jgi:hypothetical protein
MFAQIDLRKAALAQQAEELIIAKLLTYTFGHSCSPLESQSTAGNVSRSLATCPF